MRTPGPPKLRALPAPAALGPAQLDRSKVQAEERLDGKFLIETSDADISAEDAALGYKNLLEAERSFRDLKARSSCGRSSTASSAASAPTS